MGKKKPKPFKLRLKASDMQMLGIAPQSVNFTKARFNVGENEEKWIVTSTGRFVIKWNFARAKLGYTQDYLVSSLLSLDLVYFCAFRSPSAKER